MDEENTIPTSTQPSSTTLRPRVDNPVLGLVKENMLALFLFILVFLGHSRVSGFMTQGIARHAGGSVSSLYSTDAEPDPEVDKFRAETLGQTSSLPSGGPKINVGRGLLQGGFAFIGLALLGNGGIPNPFASSNGYPIRGDGSIMSKKSHGSTDAPVQAKLRYEVDSQLADRICSYNREGAERAGYFQYSSSFLRDVSPNEVTTFYDSVTGLPLFRAPIGRSFEDFVEESKIHGWPR